MSRLIFINLPVADVAASRAFFTSLDFAFDEKFSNDDGAAMVVSDQAWVMLLAEPKFEEFTAKPLADRTSTGAIVCVSANDRAGVDAFADAAMAAGATPAKDPLDYGFMYGRSFFDLDGHHWEVMWMSSDAAEQGPADVAQPD